MSEANNICSSQFYYITFVYKFHSMISRNQFISKLHNLKNYRFVAYLEQIDRDIHLVRLRIEDFKKANLPASVYLVDFIVFDNIGGLSAKSKCGTFHIDELT